MERLSSNMEQQVEWRRGKIQELCSKGYSQREISQVLQVGLASRITAAIATTNQVF
jgi:Trp operon repressor